MIELKMARWHAPSMTRTSRSAWTMISALALLSGCDPEGDEQAGFGCPERVRDSLGFEYGYDCDNDLDLIAGTASPELPACGESTVEFTLHPSEGLLRICYFQHDPGTTGSIVSADRCRPVACDSRADCPGSFTCVDSICRIGSSELSFDDILAICLAPVPWPAQCGFDAAQASGQDRIEAFLSACPDDDEPCELPPQCTLP